jgi:hypothetical protein
MPDPIRLTASDFAAMDAGDWAPPEAPEQSAYPPRVGWASAKQLEALGLRRDQLGRLRTAAGRYVCGWSGRVHLEYLLPAPWMDPAAGVVRLVWVDRETMRDLRRGIVDGGRAKVGEAVRGLIGRLFGEALHLLSGGRL